MKYFVYILQSLKDDRYYIGSTSNLDRRIKEHNSGKTKSLRHRRPLVLIHKESFATRMEAENREKQIKSYKGGQAFKRLIDGRSSRPAAGPPPHHIIPSGIFEQTMKPGPGWVFLSPEIRDI